MRIGIYDVDSKIPNLALMKIARYHLECGDNVEMFLPLAINSYDKIYASKVFDYTDGLYLDDDQMQIGGTGWNKSVALPDEIENLQPEYSIYDYPHNIGFTMRGCRFRCKFCVVPDKEGKAHSVKTIDEIWTQRNSNFVMLLDNDFFGNPDWSDRITEVHKHDLQVSFSQGLNIRIITDEQAKALASVEFRNMSGGKKQVHFAWDQWGKGTEKLIDEGFERVKSAGVKPYQMCFFVLVGWNTTEEQDLYRIDKLHGMGVDCFVMPFNRNERYQKALARWNNRFLWRNVPWKEYKYGDWGGC
ncbi:MAG: radical SAM protein [Hyphomicrobiales bacterium]|nr:radical SAM protein [Hyphomicrobiales bacterium]